MSRLNLLLKMMWIDGLQLRECEEKRAARGVSWHELGGKRDEQGAKWEMNSGHLLRLFGSKLDVCLGWWHNYIVASESSTDVILSFSYFVQVGSHPELCDFRYVVSEKMSMITALSSDPRNKVTIFSLSKHASALTSLLGCIMLFRILLDATNRNQFK